MFDPWGDQSTAGNEDDQQSEWANFGTSHPENGPSSGHKRLFEDDFARKSFEPLPDSSEYLSVLERKLTRLQGKKTPTSSRDLVKGLAALRADRMSAFLTGDSSKTGESPHTVITQPVGSDDSTGDSNFTESDAVYSSWLMQRIFPDRQALSEEELAALVRNDALARATADGSDDSLSLAVSHHPTPPGCEDAASQSSAPLAPEGEQASGRQPDPSAVMKDEYNHTKAETGAGVEAGAEAEAEAGENRE